MSHDMSNVEHFTSGDAVEVLVSAREGVWHRARVDRDAPYPAAGVGGAYIVWDYGRPLEQWESSGGWQPAHKIRRPLWDSNCARCDEVRS